MKYLAKAIVFFTCSLWFAGAATADPDLIVMRHVAERFATLPMDAHFPEGITASPSGKIFVGTFDFGGGNKLLRFGANGLLEAVKDFGGTPLLGLNPADNKVYICNFGASKIQRIAANFTAATPVEDVANITGIGAPPLRLVDNPDGTQDTITFGNAFPAPNAMVFKSDGSLYVSDSFQGAIFRIDNVQTCATPCTVTTVKHDGLLATAGFPPFGANGLAFNADESALYIANTGDDRVLRLVNLDTTNDLSVFAESINGADGLTFDTKGRLWVAANQADEVVALSNTGRVIVKLGDFLGIRHDGSAQGLIFPASLVIVGKELFVTNLALPLTGGDEPEVDVTRYTISRMKIPE